MSTPAAKPAAPKGAKAKSAPKEKKPASERRPGVTVKDVPSDAFIKEYAAYLKKAGKLRTPKWVDYVKTGISKELAPYDPDWLYVRAASMARKMYIRPNIGLGTFTKVYGDKKRRGVRPSHFAAGSGTVARFLLKELERIKVCEKNKAGGRRLTQTGQRDLDRIAGKVAVAHPISSFQL